MNSSDHQQPIARITGITLDVHDLPSARDFWQAVLGVGIDEQSDAWVLFAPQPGCAGLSLQKVPEGKEKKNRAHPDLKMTDFEDGVRRLEELGATIVREVTSPNGNHWFIMLDPDGNEFCAIQ